MIILNRYKESQEIIRYVLQIGPLPTHSVHRENKGCVQILECCITQYAARCKRVGHRGVP